MTAELIEFRDLIHRAFMGDDSSRKQLEHAAQEAFESGNFRKSALLRHEIARCYRVGEFRATGKFEEHQSIAEDRASEIRFLESWIEAHNTGAEALTALDDLSVDQVWESMHLWAADAESLFALHYLERELSKMGVVFFSPGGTIARRAAALLVQHFGLAVRTGEEAIWLTNFRVRMAIDVIARSVVKVKDVGPVD